MIKLTEENDVLNYENEPDVDRPLFPNIPVGLTDAQTLAKIIETAVTADNDAVVKHLTNEDLNNITQPGSYSMSANNSIAHKPNSTNVAAKLIVFTIDNGVYQFYLQGGSTSAPWAYRIKYGASWGSWYTVANSTIVNNRLKFTVITLDANTASKADTLTSGFNLYLGICANYISFQLYYRDGSTISGASFHAASFMTPSISGTTITYTKASSAAGQVVRILKLTTA